MNTQMPQPASKRPTAQRVPVAVCETCHGIVVVGARLKACPECGAPTTIHIMRIDPRVVRPIPRIARPL